MKVTTSDGFVISDFRMDETGRFIVEPSYYNEAINATLERELRHPYPTADGGTGNRYGASMPNVDLGDRDSIIRWLQWNDRNGCYSDEEAINEGLEPLTLREAQDAFLDILTSD